MSSMKPYDAPGEAFAIDGEVVLRGPGQIGGSMTPIAAAETARRLAIAAIEAEQQLSGTEAVAGADPIVKQRD